MKSVKQKNNICRDRKKIIEVPVKDWGVNTNIKAISSFILKKGITIEERDRILEQLSDDGGAYENQRS